MKSSVLGVASPEAYTELIEKASSWISNEEGDLKKHLDRNDLIVVLLPVYAGAAWR